MSRSTPRPPVPLPADVIPFNRACLTGREMSYVAEAINQGPLAGDGPFTARCHALLEQLTGAGTALLTTSCTHALEMAALLLDLRPGDEVIVPVVHVRVLDQRLRPARRARRCSSTSAPTRSTSTSG